MKKYIIIINKDSNEDNAKKEMFKTYQLNGQTFKVAIGVKQEVPEWVAKKAKEIGDVEDYVEID